MAEPETKTRPCSREGEFPPVDKVGNRIESPAVRYVERILVFLISLGVLAVFTHRTVFLAGNDASRFAQIESLVDQHQPSINGSRYAWTVDRVTIAGKDYSNKPPFLSIVGAGVYFALEKVFGLTFVRNEPLVVYWLTLLLVGLSTAWLLTRFDAALQEYVGAKRRDRILATAALGLGTILLSFSVTFNNHTVAAAFLFAAFCAVAGSHPVKGAILASIAFCVDPVPGGIFLVVFALMILASKAKGSLVRYLLSACLAPVLFALSNGLITGSVLPAKMISGGLDYSGKIAPSVANVLLPDDWLYPLKCLFGWHGFFLVSPILLLGVYGFIKEMRSGPGLGKAQTRWLGAGILVTILFHIFFVGSYGGWSYGFRYLIPVMPFCLLFLPRVIGEIRPSFLAPLMAISILFAGLGAYNPWPPGYEQEKGKDPVAAMVKNPVGANLGAWLHEMLGPTLLTKIPEISFISKDLRSRYQYLYLFYLSKGDRAAAEKIKAEYDQARMRRLGAAPARPH